MLRGLEAQRSRFLKNKAKKRFENTFGAPRAAQELPKSGQEGPRAAPKRPKSGQERPKSGPRAAQERPRAAPAVGLVVEQ